MVRSSGTVGAVHIVVSGPSDSTLTPGLAAATAVFVTTAFVGLVGLAALAWTAGPSEPVARAWVVGLAGLAAGRAGSAGLPGCVGLVGPAVGSINRRGPRRDPAA